MSKNFSRMHGTTVLCVRLDNKVVIAADVQRSLVFFIGFMLIDFLTCIVAFTLERHEDWSLLWPLLLQRFYYRQMIYFVLFRSVMGAVQGKSVGWRGVEPEVPAAPVAPVKV
jgi:hypothetical protein